MFCECHIIFRMCNTFYKFRFTSLLDKLYTLGFHLKTLQVDLKYIIKKGMLSLM